MMVSSVSVVPVQISVLICHWVLDIFLMSIHAFFWIFFSWGEEGEIEVTGLDGVYVLFNHPITVHHDSS